MQVSREIVVEILVMLSRLERLCQAVDVLVDRGNSHHVPRSWLAGEASRIRIMLEDTLADSPPD